MTKEAGLHRWMRVPPNERRGRVHTSTVSVVLLDEIGLPPTVDPRDVTETVTRGSGPGGQHRNKVETVVSLFHRPTGIRVTCGDTRSQHDNRRLAWERLTSRIASEHQERERRARRESRSDQVEGHKARTYREIDDIGKDHRSGKTFSVRSWLRGRHDLV